MQLDEFFNYKNRFMNDILTDEETVRLIDDECTVEDAGSLVYKKVFPYEFVPETVQDGFTFVCCDVDIIKSLDKPFWLPVMYVWVFTHKSKMRLPEGGVRVDKLCSRICGKLNGSLEYGLGELELNGVKRFAPMTDYQGKVMTFYAKDIDRLHNASRAIPSNRKA